MPEMTKCVRASRASKFYPANIDHDELCTFMLQIESYELRSKLCSWAIGHVQTGWSPIGCEGFEFLEFSLSEVIKVSEAVPL